MKGLFLFFSFGVVLCTGCSTSNAIKDLSVAETKYFESLNKRLEEKEEAVTEAMDLFKGSNCDYKDNALYWDKEVGKIAWANRYGDSISSGEEPQKDQLKDKEALSRLFEFEVQYNKELVRFKDEQEFKALQLKGKYKKMKGIAGRLASNARALEESLKKGPQLDPAYLEGLFSGIASSPFIDNLIESVKGSASKR